MPHRDWRLRIQDIIEAIEKILRYTDGMTFDMSDTLKVAHLIATVIT